MVFMMQLFDNIPLLTVLLTVLPLFYFLVLIFWKPGYPVFVSRFATTLIGISTLLAITVFTRTWQHAPVHVQWKWFALNEDIVFHAGILIDDLSAILLVVVTFISFLVHLYSIEYKKGDKHYQRYFAYLGLFTFSMLIIVISDNLFTLFMGWELVGFSSYLLIGFWFDKIKAIKANYKAFIANRIGDLGFLTALMIVWSEFGSFEFEHIRQNTDMDILRDPWMTVAGLGLFFGCAGKSAQVPLHIWLPDAMEGPTPVSALIHAATMVAAGVFLLARVYFLLNPDVLMVIAFTGALTAFTGAFSALTQTDIKRVLAYSTISQLGYMMIAIGVGAFSVAVFHLVTHALFKACLFLSAGSVIHALGQTGEKLKADNHNLNFDKQNMRIMGGLWKKLPVTFITFTIAGMALAGISLFSGFLSKDAILLESWHWAVTDDNILLFIVPLTGFFSALLTAFYVGRQVILIFFGDFRLGKNLGIKPQIQEVPLSMQLPQILLAVLCISFFFSFNPLNASHGWFLSGFEHFFASKPESGAAHHWGIGLTSMILSLTGLYIAYKVFNPKYYDASGKESMMLYSKMPSLYRLSYFNFFIDKIYMSGIIKPSVLVSRYIARIETGIIDAFVNLTAQITVIVAHILAWVERSIVDGTVTNVARLSNWVGKQGAGMQSGKIQQYFIWSFLGLLFFLAIMLMI